MQEECCQPFAREVTSAAMGGSVSGGATGGTWSGGAWGTWISNAKIIHLLATL